ncbi:hypothetical protein [Streptomyces griseoaurantiacus]|uniref:hypothetical protein n=1 Tax=Streptomyces griseoaurantiacus TaxID=68213 RepID=UPI0030E1686F
MLEKNRNIRMSVNLSNALDAVAEGKGMNASQVVRLALGAYLQTATAELALSNARTGAVELSNPVQGDADGVAGGDATDAQVAHAWARMYDRPA